MKETRHLIHQEKPLCGEVEETGWHGTFWEEHTTCEKCKKINHQGEVK